MKLNPYLSFEGTCEEALNFYKTCLDGNIEEVYHYHTMPMQVPEEYKNKVLHSVFRFGNNEFMAADIFPGQPVKNGDKQSMMLGLTDVEQSQTVFNRLADGGTVTMPLEKQFWGALYGQLTDRFGVNWMINCELAAQ